MEERITKEELLERLFHDDYENLKGKRLRLTRVRVPGKELSFAHVFTPSDKSVYENLALHIGVHEGENIEEMRSVWSESHPGRRS